MLFGVELCHKVPGSKLPRACCQIWDAFCAHDILGKTEDCGFAYVTEIGHIA